MEDLTAALSRKVHVSQDGYNIEALHEYLKQTIKLPYLSLSPSTSFHPLPSSRSTSSTRKHDPSPHPYYPDNAAQHQPYPSPSATMTSYFHSAEDLSMNTPVQRPGTLRRTSSYGFGGQKEYASNSIAAESSGFEYDAFAPLYEQPSASSSSNPWSVRPEGKANPWAAFSGQSTSFNNFQQPGAREPQPSSDITSDVTSDVDEDNDAMDEDQADEDMYEVDEEDTVERAMGFGTEEDVRAEYDAAYTEWERGRRKPN